MSGTNFWFTYGLEYVGKNGLQGETLEVILCMTNTTAEVEGSTGRDAPNVDDITLDEYDSGSPYVAGYGNRPTVQSFAITVNEAGNELRFTGTVDTLDDLPAGSRNCKGMLISIKGPTDDSDSIPLWWHTEGGFPWTGTGYPKTIEVASDGLAKLAPVPTP